MAKRRQLVLMKNNRGKAAEMAPMGSLKEVARTLAAFNTAGDGSPTSASRGTEVLHGPGMVVEVPLGVDTVTQAMVSLLDEDIAWPVLVRICKSADWKMVDIESGQTFLAG